MTAARLLFKTHRFEALAVLAAAALLAVAALYVTSRLNGVGVETDCFRQRFSSGPSEASEACSASVQVFGTINGDEAGKVMAGMALLPFIGGLLIGVPLVGRGVILPGESFTYTFDAEPFGLHLYHCHVGPLAEHIARGMYGTFIVDPPADRPPADEMVMVMHGFNTTFDGEGNQLYAVNGIPFHYMHEPIQPRSANSVLWAWNM